MRRPVPPDSCARAGRGRLCVARGRPRSGRACAPGRSTEPREPPRPRLPGARRLPAAAASPGIHFMARRSCLTLRGRAPGGGGVVNLAPGGEVPGEGPVAGAVSLRRCASRETGDGNAAPSSPAPKFFLFLARLAGLPLKRRVKRIESQVHKQAGASPRPLFSETRPASVFWNWPPRPGPPGGLPPGAQLGGRELLPPHTPASLPCPNPKRR